MKKQKLTIVGGGSTYTLGMILSLIEEKERMPLENIILYDSNADRQDKVYQGCKILLEKLYPELKSFKQTTNIKEAYKGQDLFFIQIRTGGLKMRERDEQIPLSHNRLDQETCGAGGMAYGLRSIPDMIQIIKDIRTFSNGWILNYTNPAAIVAIALDKVFPNDKKILNICDAPTINIAWYAKLINKTIWDMDPTYFGLNHFGWFTKLNDLDGNDQLELIKQKILASKIDENNSIAQKIDNLGRDNSMIAYFQNVQKTLNVFDEYLPNTYLGYYLYPDASVAHQDINNTRARQVINGREKEEFGTLEKIVKQNSIEGINLEFDLHGQYMIRVAESLVYNKKEKHIIITRNNGTISNLADDVMVEVSAILGVDEVQPLNVGKIPIFYKGMIETQNAYEQLVVEAFFSKSKKNLIQALTLNKLVNDADVAKKIVNDLYEENKSYWGEFKD